MPNWGLLSNTFLVGHEFGILITYPSPRILPAFATVRMLAVQLSKLVINPSPLNAMPKHIAKDGVAQDASLKHAQSVCILHSYKVQSLLDLGSW